jgi:hypothetical protein
MQMALAIYLLATYAGLSTDPAVLLANARCYKCISNYGLQMAVAIDLSRQMIGQ